MVQEAYVNGVSTRKVDRLMGQMGLRGLSKDQVSRMCRGLDEQVQAFGDRPLDGAFPNLRLAKVERSGSPAGFVRRRWWLPMPHDLAAIRRAAVGLSAQVPGPVEPGPYEISRVTRVAFPPCRSQHFVASRLLKYSFASVVQARNRLDLADRFA